MPTFDIDKMAEQIISAMRSYVARGIEKITQRLEVFEAQLNSKVDREGITAFVSGYVEERVKLIEIPAGKDGRDGVDGKDGAPGRDGVDGKDGRDGVDGKSVDLAAFKAQVHESASLLTTQLGKSLDAKLLQAIELVEKLVSDARSTVAEIQDGRDGVDGKDGAPGKDGRDGKDGIDGKDGAQGPQGERGEPGVNGKDGEVGPRGEKGEPGLSGKDGAPGPQGERGEKGIDGRDGRDAKDGRDGKDGEAGRDALDITVLQEIFKSKSYPRGTFAEYKGGMIYATRNTDPMDDSRSLIDAGWRCALRGIAHEETELLDDGRIEKRTTTYTDGTVRVVQHKTANVVFRGVQKSGQLYERGDQVLRGGSTWICLRDTTSEARPGAEDWVLSTKKGSDGRDGKNGAQGPRGPEGKPGKDLTQMAFDGTKY